MGDCRYREGIAVTALPLPETLDRKAVSEFSKALLAHRGADIVLDAGGVRKLAAIGVEMLIAARLQWQADGARLEIRGWSEGALQTTQRIGAAPEMLQTGGAA